MARLFPTKSPRSTFSAAFERELIERCLRLREQVKPAPCPQYKQLPSYDRLHQLLVCNAAIGELYHRLNHPGTKKGDRAGCNHFEYRKVSVDGVQHMVHRVIWKMVHGKDPVGQIDHVSGVRNDNRIENLKDVSPLENCRNRHSTSSNTGHRGVSWCNTSRRYLACIGLGNRTIHLGKFVKLECAVKARECGEKWLYAPLSQKLEAA